MLCVRGMILFFVSKKILEGIGDKKKYWGIEVVFLWLVVYVVFFGDLNLVLNIYVK